MPRKVSFLTVIWGESYIERFATLALPSFLAPGNLPALAALVDLEVVIMTRWSDRSYFENQPAFHRLKALCPVRFVDIEDLITEGNYGVTLTAAYLRPIVRMGEKMLETHFLFMNADFVLADGSLRSLAKHIVAGRSIVLGPSFRATAEDVEPVLHGLTDKATGVLAVSPRKLTALSLAHPHPTTIAKTLDQGFIHTIHPNQFFWRINDHCLLGHYFLIFMLCLKPERIIESINSYCDYAFIPEMCPSGDEVAMGDSDEFFMLELQQREQEASLLRLGKASEREIAKSLQFWTTAEHRRASRYPIIFHSQDIPPEIAMIKNQAAAFLDRIQTKLKKPVPHKNHTYWIHGVATWRYLRSRRGLSTSPSEIGFIEKYSKKSLSFMSLSFMYSSRSFFRKLQTTPLHPHWLDHYQLRNAAGNLPIGPEVRPLFLQDSDGKLDQHAVRHTNGVLKKLDWLDEEPSLPIATFTHVVIYLTIRNSHRAYEIIKRCNPMLTTPSNCRVFIDYPGHERECGDPASEDLLSKMDCIVGIPPMEGQCTFVGGALKKINGYVFQKLAEHYTHFGVRAFLWIAPIMVLWIPVSLLINFYLHAKQPSPSAPRYISSIALTFRKPM